MELTRRDALTALTAAGVAATAGCSGLLADDQTATEDDAQMDTMLALGEVLYPSQTGVTEEFIDTYLMGRIVDDEAYQSALADGVETLNERAQDAEGTTFADLDESQRVSLIEDTELRSGDSVADGSPVERVNYFLIDELLFAFYSSPVGGELVGNPNPRGWPGGFGYELEEPQ